MKDLPYGPWWLRRRVSPKKLDLRARFLEVAQRRLGGRRGGRLAVDREVEVEPVLEGTADHRAAVQARQVDRPLPKAVEGVGEAPRPVRRDERDGALPARAPVAGTRGCSLLDDHKAGPVLRVVLDRFRQHVQPVPGGGRLAGDGCGAGLPLLG